MESKLKEEGVTSLWHFTDINNLSQIYKQGGLLSKQKIDELIIEGEVRFSGDALSHELDKRNGNWDKISLSFISNTPMFYNIKTTKHFVLIEIDSNIINENTFFTDKNATANDHKRGEGIEGLNLVNFEALNETLYSEFWQVYSQAEVLIKDFISIECFKNIHFMSEKSLQMGEFVEPGLSNKYITNFSAFEDFTPNNHDIPLIEDVLFTYQHITKNNYNNDFTEISNLILGKELHVRVKALQNCSLGITVVYKCKDGNCILKISEEINLNPKSYVELTFWSEPGDCVKSKLDEYSELYVDIYLGNVIYYQTYLSV